MNLQKILLAFVSTTVYATKERQSPKDRTAWIVQKFKRETDYRPETSLTDRMLQCNFKQCNTQQVKDGKDWAILVNNLVKYGPVSYFNLHEEGRYLDPNKVFEQLSAWRTRKGYAGPFLNLAYSLYSSAYEPYYKSIGSGIPAPYFWDKTRMDTFFKVHKFKVFEKIKKSIKDYLNNICK